MSNTATFATYTVFSNSTNARSGAMGFARSFPGFSHFTA